MRAAISARLLRGSLQPDVEGKVFNASVDDMLGPFPSPDENLFEIFVVNAKAPARLDEETINEVRRIVRDEWLAARAKEHGIELLWLPAFLKGEQALTDESLIEFLGSVEFFSAFTPQDLEVIATHVESRTFEFGDTVCNAGDPSEGLFLIKKGAVRLFTEEQGKEISMGVRKEREVFGEISVLRHYRHESSVRASAKTELLYFPHEAFKDILERNRDAHDFIANYVAINTAGGFVTRLFDLRRKVKGNEMEQIIRSVGIKRVREGRSILEQGDRDDRRLYVVRQGRVRVVRNEENTEYPLATLGQGEVFGEKACLNRQEQPASVIAETDVVLLVVPEKTIRLILERNPKTARCPGRAHQVHGT